MNTNSPTPTVSVQADVESHIDQPSQPSQPSQSAQPAINVVNLSKHFLTPEGSVTALHRISMRVAPHEFVTIIGPSGCGKSTLFNVLAGLELPDEGTLAIEGQEALGKRGLVAYMPQRDALLPWKTVVENAILPTVVRRGDVAAAREEARSLLPTFGLEGFGDSLPLALSGGMRQRAALLRTILWHRPFMLLDEPFGALDALTRAHLQQWLLTLWETLDRTIVLVTHDVDEAILLSDRVYVFTPRPGRVAEEVVVPFARPRHFSLITEPSFGRLKERLLRLLGNIAPQDEGAAAG